MSWTRLASRLRRSCMNTIASPRCARRPTMTARAWCRRRSRSTSTRRRSRRCPGAPRDVLLLGVAERTICHCTESRWRAERRRRRARRLEAVRRFPRLGRLSAPGSRQCRGDHVHSDRRSAPAMPSTTAPGPTSRQDRNAGTGLRIGRNGSDGRPGEPAGGEGLIGSDRVTASRPPGRDRARSVR